MHSRQIDSIAKKCDVNANKRFIVLLLFVLVILNNRTINLALISDVLVSCDTSNSKTCQTRSAD